jgi:type VI secretion system protein ImpA
MAGLADAAGIIQKIKTATIVTLPGFGPLTIHMLEVATGETVVGDDEERIAVASLRAALSDVSEAVLVEVVDALARSRSSVEAIEILLVRQVGNAQALNLTPLVRILNRAHLFFAEQSPVNVISDATGNMSDRDSGAEQCSPSSRVGSTAVNGEIASRAEVIRVLDSVLRYYVQYEPSSPVPVLLSRAKRLVPKSFMQIMEDLAPDSMQQMLVFQGNAEDSHNR